MLIFLLLYIVQITISQSIDLKDGKVEPEREGKALINPEYTKYNTYELHEKLKPTFTVGKQLEEGTYVRGSAIAEVHNSQVTSMMSRARLNAKKEKDESKAIGVIATLPKDFMQSAIPELTDEEFYYWTNKIEAGLFDIEAVEDIERE